MDDLFRLHNHTLATSLRVWAHPYAFEEYSVRIDKNLNAAFFCLGSENMYTIRNFLSTLPPVLDIEQAAKALGFSVSDATAAFDEGALVGSLRDGRWWVTRESLTTQLESLNNGAVPPSRSRRKAGKTSEQPDL